jgi:hypothetical protein
MIEFGRPGGPAEVANSYLFSTMRVPFRWETHSNKFMHLRLWCPTNIAPVDTSHVRA